MTTALVTVIVVEEVVVAVVEVVLWKGQVASKRVKEIAGQQH